MEFKTQPFSHQLAAFERSKDSVDFALLMEAGTGKTKVVIDTAANLYLQGKIDSLIVVAPNGVHRNWLGEVDAHLPDSVPRAQFYYQSGAGVRHKTVYDWVVKYSEGLRILTYNIEALSIADAVKHLKSVIGQRKCLLVIDESHTIKAPGSKRTKNAQRLSDLVPYRRILTGTPTEKGVEDLYSQFKFLDWRIIGVKTFAAFKGEFCVMGGYDNREIIGYRNVEVLKRKIAPYVFEANKKDCFDLPEFWITREVELSPEQRRLYRQMRDEFIAELRDHTIEAPLAGVRMLRLRQILSGLYPHEDGTLENLPCPRLEACADLVEESSRGKVIVWCHFKADVVNVTAKLAERGIKSVQYYGALSSSVRYDNLQKWRTDPDICGLVATPPSGGVGLTLNEADTDVTYSHDYSYLQWVQKSARNCRAGQTKPVTHYDLVARGTADVRMMTSVRNKGSIADSLKNTAALLELLED